MDITLFGEMNPWKKNASFLPEGLVSRKVSRMILEQIDKPLIAVLLGPRRSGKSTLLWQIINHLINKEGVDPQQINYFSFDDIDMRADFKSYRTFDEVFQLVCGQRLSQLREKAYFFIDEVQKVPEFFEVLKIAYDQFRGNIKFVISGSASLEIASRVSGALAGRVDYYRIHPFQLAEIRDLDRDSILLGIIKNKIDKKDLNILQSQILGNYSDYISDMNQALIYGLLPEVVLCKKEEDKKHYLRNYRVSYLEKDVRTLEQIGNLDEYIRVMDSLILNMSGILNLAELSRQLGAAVNTVKKYISILQGTFVLGRLNCYQKNLKRRIIKSPKLFLFDNGLYSLSSNIYSLKQLENTGMVGRLFENLVINEIFKHIDAQDSRIEAYYWRTSSGIEVDLVLENGGELSAVEIKYKKDVDKKDIAHLKKFAADYPGAIKHLFLIYNGTYQLVNDVICLPLWMV